MTLATLGDSPADQVWLACSAGEAFAIGEQVLLTVGRDYVVGGRFAMVTDGAEYVMAKRVAIADAPALVDRLRGPSPTALPPPGLPAPLPPALLRPLGGGKVGGPEIAPRDPESPDDLRTL